MTIRASFASRLPKVVAAAAFGLSLTAVTATAAAQEQPADTARQPAPAPGYAPAQPSGGYVAPLSQQTQPTYVPQSVALSGPKEITDFNEDGPIPAGYTPVERTRKGMVISGSILFGSLYGLSALVAAADADSYRPDLQALWVPAVGPFVQMFQTESAVGNFFLAIDGVGQTAGLAMFIYGLASPRTVLVRNDLAQVKPTVTVAPMSARGGGGLSLVGTF